LAKQYSNNLLSGSELSTSSASEVEEESQLVEVVSPLVPSLSRTAPAKGKGSRIELKEEYEEEDAFSDEYGVDLMGDAADRAR